MKPTLRELRGHLGRDEIQLVKVGEDQHLQVDAGYTGLLAPAAKLVDDQRDSVVQASVGPGSGLG